MSRRKEDVKIAGLWKRSQNISMFTKPNYKHRVFILTSSSLSYYCGTIDVSLYSLAIGRVHPLAYGAACTDHDWPFSR